MSTVLLLQPQAAVGARLQALIDAMPDFEVVGCVQSADALRDAATLHDPDLLLADLHTLGPAVATRLRQLRQGRYDRPRVLVIAMSADDPRLVDALRDGVDGWFSPGASRSLPACMTQVLRGETTLTKAIARAVQAHFDSRAWLDTDVVTESQNPLRLSATERILLQWTVDGRTPADLARALESTVQAVGVRMRTILRKWQFDLAADQLKLVQTPPAR